MALTNGLGNMNKTLSVIILSITAAVIVWFLFASSIGLSITTIAGCLAVYAYMMDKVVEYFKKGNFTKVHIGITLMIEAVTISLWTLHSSILPLFTFDDIDFISYVVLTHKFIIAPYIWIALVFHSICELIKE